PPSPLPKRPSATVLPLATDQMIRPCGQEPSPCPPCARKEGHPRRFTVSHGATGSALELCDRRSAGCGHLLCGQGFEALSSTGCHIPRYGYASTRECFVPVCFFLAGPSPRIQTDGHGHARDPLCAQRGCHDRLSGGGRGPV